MNDTIPVPLSIKLLIEEHKSRVEASLKNLTDANIELMQMLNILPSDGWRLDLDNLRYIRVKDQNTDESSPVE